MDKSKIKVLFLSICLVIAIVMLVLIILLKLFYKQDSFDKILKEKIEIVNSINSSLNTDNIEKKPSYFLEDNIACKKYIGNNKEEIIDKINKVYIEPFHQDSIFSYIDNGEEEILYLCIPDTLRLENISSWEIIEDNEKEKVIKIGKNKFVILKQKNDWKFVYPVLLHE